MLSFRLSLLDGPSGSFGLLVLGKHNGRSVFTGASLLNAATRSNRLGNSVILGLFLIHFHLCNSIVRCLLGIF